MIWRLGFSLVLFWIGWFLLRWVWRDVQVVKKTKSWSSAPGRLMHTGYRENVIKGENSDSTFYVPIVQYEYQVGQQSYQGNRIAFSEEQCCSIDEVLGAFPVGQPVTVFYDPARPGDAVLRRRDTGNVGMAIAGWILVAVGIAVLFDGGLFNE